MNILNNEIRKTLFLELSPFVFSYFKREIPLKEYLKHIDDIGKRYDLKVGEIRGIALKKYKYYTNKHEKMIKLIKKNDNKVIKELDKKYLHINYRNNTTKTLLIIAVEEGNYEVTEKLLKKGADVNACTGFNQNALFKILYNRRKDKKDDVKILNLILEYKINEQIIDNNNHNIFDFIENQTQKSDIQEYYIKLKEKQALESQIGTLTSKDKKNRNIL